MHLEAVRKVDSRHLDERRRRRCWAAAASRCTSGSRGSRGRRVRAT